MANRHYSPYREKNLGPNSPSPKLSKTSTKFSVLTSFKTANWPMHNSVDSGMNKIGVPKVRVYPAGSI
jgi:hypothetical protein